VLPFLVANYSICRETSQNVNIRFKRAICQCRLTSNKNMSRSANFTEDEMCVMVEGVIDWNEILYGPQRPGGPTEKDNSATWAEIAEASLNRC